MTSKNIRYCVKFRVIDSSHIYIYIEMGVYKEKNW